MPMVMKILAIDPGYARLGIAVVSGTPGTPHIEWSDCVTPPKGSPGTRLAHISSVVSDTLSTYAPDVLAIEGLFFSKNKKTALRVAEVRGVILSLAAGAGITVAEYSPQQVKVAVTGHGQADKKSVSLMVPRLVALSEKKRLDDEFDAIAIGLTALAHAGT